MSDKKEEQKQTSTSTNPWDKQSPYLTDAFGQAQNIFNGGRSNVYGGDLVAGLNGDQVANYQNMIRFGSTSGVPALTQGTGAALTGSGMSGLTGALDTLGGFRPSGSVDSNINAAGRYADNPFIGGQVDATMRDARRQVSEQELPGIAASSAVTGNVNSSRRALAEGVVERGLADKTADVSSQLRGDAYARGLDLAQRGSEFNDTSALDAARSRGALGSSTVGTGLGALGQSLDQQAGLFGLAGQGGAGLQQGSQLGLDNSRGRSEYSTDRLNQMLQQYYGVIGGNNWGGSSTGTQNTTTTSSPGGWSVLGGLMNAGGNVFGKNGVGAQLADALWPRFGLPGGKGWGG